MIAKSVLFAAQVVTWRMPLDLVGTTPDVKLGMQAPEPTKKHVLLHPCLLSITRARPVSPPQINIAKREYNEAKGTVGCPADAQGMGKFVTPPDTPVTGWVGPRPPHPPTPASCRCERAFDSTPTHPHWFFRVRAQGPRATHARLFPRSCVASTSWERAAAAAANGSGAHASSGAGGSSALVAGARSIRRPRRRALLLPHTYEGAEARVMR